MKSNGVLIGLVLLGAAGIIGVVMATSGNDDKPKTEDTNHSNTQSSTNQESGTQESESSQAVATTEVEIKDFIFTPAMIKVKVGDTVKWTNQDSVQHNVQADDDSSENGPDGPLLSKGESYEFTFTKAGTYTYHCTPHPQMTGTVIVE